MTMKPLSILPFWRRACPHSMVRRAMHTNQTKWVPPTPPAPLPAYLSFHQSDAAKQINAELGSTDRRRTTGGVGIMQQIKEEEMQRLDPSGSRRALLDRTSPSCLTPGSIVVVKKQACLSKPAVHTFIGTLLEVRRKGVASSITLRNVVHRQAVELSIPVFSPLVKGIDVVRKVNRFRRARLTFLRDPKRKESPLLAESFAGKKREEIHKLRKPQL